MNTPALRLLAIQPFLHLPPHPTLSSAIRLHISLFFILYINFRYSCFPLGFNLSKRCEFSLYFLFYFYYIYFSVMYSNLNLTRFLWRSFHEHFYVPTRNDIRQTNGNNAQNLDDDRIWNGERVKPGMDQNRRNDGEGQWKRTGIKRQLVLSTVSIWVTLYFLQSEKKKSVEKSKANGWLDSSVHTQTHTHKCTHTPFSLASFGRQTLPILYT